MASFPDIKVEFTPDLITYNATMERSRQLLAEAFCVPEPYWEHTIISNSAFGGITKAKENKMYVFEVTLVNKEKDEIVYDSLQVASNKEIAERKAFQEYLKEMDDPVDVEKLHFASTQVGPGYSK